MVTFARWPVLNDMYAKKNAIILPNALRKEKVRAKERSSDLTTTEMEEMLEQEEIGMIQVGQKENGLNRAGTRVLGKSRVGKLPNNLKENLKLNKIKMVIMWVRCSISVSTC